MPSAWQQCVIEELATDEPNAMCIGPFGSDLLSSDLVDHGVPVVFVRNVRPGRFDGTDLRYVTPAKAEKLRSHRVRPGDIVVTKMGLPPCIAAAYPEGSPDGIVTADIIKMSPDTAKVDPRYLIHFLNSPVAKAQVARFTFGVTRPKVTLKDFRALRLNLPPLPEQRRIADILDKADAIRRKRKEAIALTEELLRSAFLEMFGDPVTNPKGWPVTTLGDEAEQMKYGTSEKCDATAGAGLPVLRIPNVVGGEVDWDDLKYADLDEKEATSLRLRKGDILFVRSNGNPAYIGRCAVYDSERAALFASYLIRVRVNSERLEPGYVRAALSSRSYRALLTSEARTTAGNYNISTEGLRRLRLPLPPLEKQRQLAAFTESVRRARSGLVSAAGETETLFFSLVHRAFRGELTGGRANGKSQLGLFQAEGGR